MRPILPRITPSLNRPFRGASEWQGPAHVVRSRRASGRPCPGRPLLHLGACGQCDEQNDEADCVAVHDTPRSKCAECAQTLKTAPDKPPEFFAKRLI
jgi:hypothetical protein